MSIVNIAGYHFVALENLPELKASLLSICLQNALRGTIILSEEGINIALAGESTGINHFKAHIANDEKWGNIQFNESLSEINPFKRMKIKIKTEVITMRRKEIKPEVNRAPTIQPSKLKEWLDSDKNLTLLDTRNDYEIKFGTFDRALDLQIKHFCELPEDEINLPKDRPIVMFCTGGIRCEKAALYLAKEGYEEVYQLEGGILKYFAEVGGAHYRGDCYVFDERIAVNPKLEETHLAQCEICQGPVEMSMKRCGDC